MRVGGDSARIGCCYREFGVCHVPLNGPHKRERPGLEEEEGRAFGKNSFVVLMPRRYQVIRRQDMKYCTSLLI